MDHSIIPSIPGVQDVIFSQSGNENANSAGRRTQAASIRSVQLSTAILEPHERIAALLAYLLVPDEKSHMERIRAYETICWLAGYMYLAWPSRTRSYMFLDKQDACTTLNRLRRLYRHRQAAAAMAYPYILRDSRFPPNDGPVPKRCEMAACVASLANEAEPKNVELRVWGKSLPTVHLALAVVVRTIGLYCEIWRTHWEPRLPEIEDASKRHRFLTENSAARLLYTVVQLRGLEFMLLFGGDQTEHLLSLAEGARERMPFCPTLAKAAERSIRFSLRPP